MDIAVGMATSILPHNLVEIVDGVKAYMKNNEIQRERSDEIHQRTGFSDRRYRD